MNGLAGSVAVVDVAILFFAFLHELKLDSRALHLPNVQKLDCSRYFVIAFSFA
jgi:hypothetical protein